MYEEKHNYSILLTHLIDNLLGHIIGLLIYAKSREIWVVRDVTPSSTIGPSFLYQCMWVLLSY